MKSVDAPVLRGMLTLQHDRKSAAPVLNALASGERHWNEVTAAEVRLLEGVPLIDLLLQESFELRYRDPAAMLRLAEKARILTDSLSPRRYGRRVLANLKARSWAEFANACRVVERYSDAEEAFGHAAYWARRGTGDLRLTARISDLAASLLSDQRCFSEAYEYLKFACSAYQSLGEDQLAGRALIKMGLLFGRDMQPDRAIVLLVQGLRLTRLDRSLELTALHGLSNNLAELGHYSEARAILARIRRLCRRDKSLINRLRIYWLEAKIASGLGQLGRAEGSFQIARLGFRKLDRLYDSALVSLDLALLYAKQGRRLEIRRLAAEMIGTFRAYRIAREVIASLVLLQKNSDQPGVSLDQLRGQIQTLSLLLAELERRPVRARP